MTYDIIPISTLISSTINLTVNAIGRLYQAINYIWNKNKDLSTSSEYNDNELENEKSY